MKNRIIIFDVLIIFIITAISCTNQKEQSDYSYSLISTNKKLNFNLDSNTKNFIIALFPYQDKMGTHYITFQNFQRNELLFYNLETERLEFKITPDIAGNNGVGLFTGYYIHNLDSIFLTLSGLEEICLINKGTDIISKYQFDKTKEGFPLQHFTSTSAIYHPLVKINNTLYIMPVCNRWVDNNPLCVTIDLNNQIVNVLSVPYPTFPGADNRAKVSGIENYVSRIYDDKHFIYSFHFDEDIYIVPPSHEELKKIKVKSKYIKKVELLDDYGNITFEDMCENPNYGNLLYDKYREVYYRTAYPATKIEKGVKGMELMQYGRKNFSIIILDKDFNIIGETLFPDYTYNSTLMFVHEDGLYISSSHYLNPQFSDDLLTFECFKLQKE